MPKSLRIHQGNILKIENIKELALVVSKDFFNETGLAVVCPVVEKSIESPLHIFIDTEKTTGFVHCEDIKTIDTKARICSVVEQIDLLDIINITDTIQGIFDYI